MTPEKIEEGLRIHEVLPDGPWFFEDTECRPDHEVYAIGKWVDYARTGLPEALNDLLSCKAKLTEHEREIERLKKENAQLLKMLGPIREYRGTK